MNTRFTLADKISSTVVIIGLLSIILVYYISSTYKKFAYDHHMQSIQQLANLKTTDLINELKANSLDLALSIEHETEFKNDFQLKKFDALTKQLDNQFYQYFVTAGVIKLLKLYVLDTDFTLLSTSSEGVEIEKDSKLICPKLSHQAFTRQGSEKLQTLSRLCTHKNTPVLAVIVPFGGLSPKGYIQVITDLAYQLQDIERSLAMPIKISFINNKTIYQSEKWLTTDKGRNYLNVDLPIVGDDDTKIMNISLQSDMTEFNREITQHRNWIMALTLVTTALAVFIILFWLRHSTIQPLSKIHHMLENIHSQSSDADKTNRMLFSQLLEQIIQLRQQNPKSFAVMILDLTHFKEVNIEFGKEIGDRLLNEVENRLGSVLRDSDSISWVGTDSPGHKLLPADTQTKYHATIARLGGDEFGLLLPSTDSNKQALAVANRIVKTLSKAFSIDDHSINIKCEIGISFYPRDGDDEKQLIRNADTAMYDAKKHSQSIFIFDSNSK